MNKRNLAIEIAKLKRLGRSDLDIYFTLVLDFHVKIDKRFKKSRSGRWTKQNLLKFIKKV